MKIVAPDYYKNFKCIADKCHNNCCTGWEIDIDSTTLTKYNELTGSFGELIKKNISISDDSASFKLTDDERCPFLNSSGLCDIILNLGEASICQICTDHPRFRNFYSGLTEIGLGMCCEEAAKLIVTHGDKSAFIVIEGHDTDYTLTDNENALLTLRKDIFDILQNRTHSIDSRVEKLLSVFSISLSVINSNNWIDTFLNLEHMDSNWPLMLQKAKCYEFVHKKALPANIEIAFEQILIYFIYRHLSRGLYDGKFTERIAFSVLSYSIIRNIFEGSGMKSVDELIEICRLYSCEIEYSEENVEILLENLSTI